MNSLFFSFRSTGYKAIAASTLILAAAALSGASAQAQTTVPFTTAGNGTWTCPTGVTSVQVEAWGGGGGGGGVSGVYEGAGGGAGGSYVKYTVTVTPNTTYQLTVGAGGTAGPGGSGTGGPGGSSFFGNTTAGVSTGAAVLAVGGPGAVSDTSSGSSSSNYNTSNGATGTSSGDLPTSGATITAGGNGGKGPGTTKGSGAGGTAPTGSIAGGTGGAALGSQGGGTAGGTPGGGGSGGDIGSTTGTNVGGVGGVGEVLLTYTPAAPTITAAGSLSPLLGYQGTASGPTTFVASGSNLSNPITITAPSGFEISTAPTGGYSNLVILNPTSGTVAPTIIFVRLTASDLVNTYSGNVTLTSTGATTVNEAVPTSTVVQVNAFTQGNILIQAATGTVQNTTAEVVELNPAATQASPVQTIPLPSTNINSNPTLAQALCINGSGGTTGYLSSSNDGTQVVIDDPDALSASDLGQTTAASILNRAVVTFGSSANLTFQAYYTGVSGNQARAATTLDHNLWFVADKGGIYTTSASSPATTPDSTTNMLNARTFGGAVYGFSATAPGVTSIVSTGSSTGALTPLPGLSIAGATDFYLISSGVNGATYDVCYVSTGLASSGTITKFSLASSGTWVSSGTYTTTFGGRSIIAAGNGAGATLYLSGADGGTAAAGVYKLTDTAGYNQPISVTTANNVNLYTFTGNNVPKGIAFVPLPAARPDLTIAVAGPISSATPSFAYTVTVANSGAASATGVNAQLTLPAGLSFSSGSDNGSAGFTVSASGNVVAINGGTLAAGATETITVNVTGSNGGTYTVDAGPSATTSGDGLAVINTSATTATPIAESNVNNNSDNISTTTAIATPMIFAFGTPSAVSTSFGIASAPTTFTASGTNLTGPINLVAPAGFELSTSSASGYLPAIVLNPTSGTVASTTIYVRLAATTRSGSYSGSVNLNSSGATPVNVVIPSSTVAPSANLATLSASTGGFTQPYSATVTSYTQYVGTSISSLAFSYLADSGATVTVNGQPATQPVNLNPGVNTLNVVVTDGGSVQTYTVTVIRAGAFTPGDLVVTTYGNYQVATAHPDGQATLLTMSEFSPTIAPNSTPVMQFALPGAGATGNNAGITGEYGSSSEGTIQQTPDGLHLTIGGYAAGPGIAFTGTSTTALAQSPCAIVPRVAAFIDLNTNCDTTSVFNDIYNTNNPRSVFSPDGFDFYLSGQGAGIGDEGGLYYTQLGTNTTTGGAMPTSIFNAESTRTVLAYGGNLYYSADQNSSKGILTGIFEYTGLPTSAEQTGTYTGTRLTPASAGNVNYSPQGFWFANATTMYVADTGDPKAGEGSNSTLSDGGIQKWVYNGSAWTLAYTLTSPNFVPSSQTGTATVGETGLEALTGTVTNGVAYLYGCSYTLTDAGANGLYGVTDTLTATSSTATLTEIAAAPGQQAAGSTNPDYNFKGVTFAPVGAPVNAVPPSNITATGAVLSALLNPEGTDTLAFFQYGTSTGYGSQTTTQDLGTGSSPVPVNIPVGGLQAGTTYYYRLVTISNGVTSYYAGQSFTTTGTAPVQTPTDTPTMPPAGLVMLALALMGFAFQGSRRKLA